MIEVFRARKVITMNPSWPEASLVAVKNGQIMAVGNEEALSVWRQQEDITARDDFADSVLMPGLIDPHLHPMMAAVLLPMQFITAMEWRLPWEQVAATTTPDAYLDRLRQYAAADVATPFFTWGYHSHWHGDMNRQLLDELFGNRPAVVWQRSFHEVYLNSAMIRQLNIDEERVRGRHQIDIDRGHFFENGLGYAINKLNPIIMSAEWIQNGLQRLKAVAHHGGHTSLGDMAVGIFDVELEWQAAQQVLENPDTPFRVVSVVHAMRAGAPPGDTGAQLAAVEQLRKRSSHRFQYPRKIKLFTDGAFFSQLAMLKAPGYSDGHEGEWLIPPEQYEEVAREFWHAGYEIHVHCTGDMGLELAIETLEKLLWERPRFNHGYTIEHFGFSTPEQVRRLKLLGARVSANTYYLHELSHAYAEQGVGVERAHQMARLGACEAADVLWTLHSDFPMAPAMPLLNAWVATTRINAEGQIVAPDERVSLQKALEAVTINAAEVLGISDITGSLRAGKSADMVVLDEDPFEVGAEGLKDLSIQATVFEGQVYPLT